MRRRFVVAVGLALASGACGIDDEGVPPGKLAVVGDKVLGPEDLSGVQAQLGRYAQLRFRGEEGRAGLLEALIAAELMAQEAIDEGLGDDPRVEWARLEEEATLYLNAQLERRVPREQVAADRAALRARYDASPDRFWIEEHRNLEGVVFSTYDQAEAALERLHAGEVTLESLGDLVITPLQARDDHEHPGFHPILFEPGLAHGDVLSAPVVVARRLIVGRIRNLEPARRRPFDDPEVQEQLVREVRAPRLAEARAALLQELAERFPEAPP